jgi:hypothetical protein
MAHGHAGRGPHAWPTASAGAACAAQLGRLAQRVAHSARRAAAVLLGEPAAARRRDVDGRAAGGTAAVRATLLRSGRRRGQRGGRDSGLKSRASGALSRQRP